MKNKTALHLKCPYCQEACTAEQEETLTKENGNKYIVCPSCGADVIFCKVVGSKDE